MRPVPYFACLAVLVTLLVASVAGCGQEAGTPQDTGNARVVRSLVERCSTHGGLRAYAFTEHGEIAVTAVCEDDTVIEAEPN